ncbi:MAG TPA: site-specific DNA-methyltransferase [Fibrella sp.]
MPVGHPLYEFEIGQEATPEEYIARLVSVFLEVRRVLKPWGVCWLNLGDSYWGGKGKSGNQGKEHQQLRSEQGKSFSSPEAHVGGKGKVRPTDRRHDVFKPKDLMMMPHRLAIALQESGWYVRQDVVWAKPNPMPESVRDRCTKSHEYVFMLTKSKKYYFDWAAIQEPISDSERTTSGNIERKPGSARGCPEDNGSNVCGSVPWQGLTRNKRSVWTVATQPFKEAHFATFPQELIIPMIKASTSDKGNCPNCGRPWKRLTTSTTVPHPNRWSQEADAQQFSSDANEYDEGGALGVATQTTTIGWEATCKCNSSDKLSRPVVMDVFSGAGTTAKTAALLGRPYIGIDINGQYIKLSDKRIDTDLGPLTKLFNAER